MGEGKSLLESTGDMMGEGTLPSPLGNRGLNVRKGDNGAATLLRDGD